MTAVPAFLSLSLGAALASSVALGPASFTSSTDGPTLTTRRAPSLGVRAPEAPSKKLRGNLPAILAAAAEDELVPVTVVLRDQADPAALEQAASIPNKAERREAVVALLKSTAEATQGALLAALDGERDAGRVGERVRPLWIHNVIAAEATPAVVEALAARADVAWISHDVPLGPEVFPIQPRPERDGAALGGGGGGALTGGQVECGVELMGAPDVWNDFGLTGDGVVVGMIDTGACLSHPDLADHIWQNPGEIANNGVDDDGNGYVDDVAGWNFRDNTNNVHDEQGHGTHTAGTVAGDGTDGVQTGMAPDASLMILKFWNNFAGESVVWEATQYGVENGADVLSASIGWIQSVDPDRATWRAVCENAMNAGVVVVYAAGNEGNCCGIESVRTPGDVPDMITVGATDCNDSIAGFSSRGPVSWENVDPYNDYPYPPGKMKPTISAPGVDTVSTSNQCSGYFSLSGTSMATPHVAGTVALILQANPSLDHYDVKQLLKDTAIDLGVNGPDNDYGHGRVDAYAAVEAAMNVSGPASIDAVQVTMGTLLAGGPGELDSSDDEYVRARSAYGFSTLEPNLITVRIDLTTGLTEATLFDVDVESRINNPNGVGKLRFRNFATGQFEQVDTFSLGTDDSTAFFLDVPAGNYVRASDGRIEMMIRNVVVATFSAQGFDAFIDHVQVLPE